jgi:hypothetical protein
MIVAKYCYYFCCHCQTTSNNEELEAAAELEELWIKHQIEQQLEDQHDLKLFHQMRKEESDIERAKRAYKRLVKKYVNNSLLSSSQQQQQQQP